MHFATIYAIYFYALSLLSCLWMDGWMDAFSYPCCVELVLSSRQTLLVCTVSYIHFFSHLEAQETHNTLYVWSFYALLSI